MLCEDTPPRGAADDRPVHVGQRDLAAVRRRARARRAAVRGGRQVRAPDHPPPAVRLRRGRGRGLPVRVLAGQEPPRPRPAGVAVAVPGALPGLPRARHERDPARRRVRARASPTARSRRSCAPTSGSSTRTGRCSRSRSCWGSSAALGVGRARRSGLRTAAFLFTFTALAVYLPSVAVSQFTWRYQLPLLVLLPPAGALGLAALTGRTAPQRGARIEGNGGFFASTGTWRRRVLRVAFGPPSVRARTRRLHRRQLRPPQRGRRARGRVAHADRTARHAPARRGARCRAARSASSGSTSRTTTASCSTC